jgi:hypothetical protein
MLKRLAAVASTAALLAAVPVGAAQADPTKVGTLDLTGCDNGATYTINESPGHGNWTPGLLAEGNAVLHPTFFDFTFTPTGGEPDNFFSIDRNAPAGKTLITCSIGPLSDEEGTFTGVVTFWVSPPR